MNKFIIPLLTFCVFCVGNQEILAAGPDERDRPVVARKTSNFQSRSRGADISFQQLPSSEGPKDAAQSADEVIIKRIPLKKEKSRDRDSDTSSSLSSSASNMPSREKHPSERTESDKKI